MSIRALVADDSGVMRTIIKRCLHAVGVENVVEARDGEQALELFALGTYDLVLTDWNMPGKNGLQVVKGIRNLGSEVPIIMVTTESERGRVLEAIQAGITDYLTKPFDAEKLEDKLGKYVHLPTLRT